MRVKGYELDYLFCNSLGYDNVGEMLCQYSVKKYKELKYKFIKDNNITILKYKGDDKWGGFIYDSLLELSDFLENNYVEHLEDLKTDLPKTLLTKIREMKVVQKVNGRYKWIGSRNYQALTNIVLKHYVSPTDKAKELIKQYKENAYREACILYDKTKDDYYESVKYELEKL